MQDNHTGLELIATFDTGNSCCQDKPFALIKNETMYYCECTCHHGNNTTIHARPEDAITDYLLMKYPKTQQIKMKSSCQKLAQDLFSQVNI